MKFHVRLKAAHDKTGLTPYMVAKRTGVAINTVVRYVSSDVVEISQLSPAVPILAEFYGLDWRDPAVVEVIEDDEEEEEQPLVVLGETKLG